VGVRFNCRLLNASSRRPQARSAQIHGALPSKHDATQVISCHPRSDASKVDKASAEHRWHFTAIVTLSTSGAKDGYAFVTAIGTLETIGRGAHPTARGRVERGVAQAMRQ
jgi:hypothetical protein